LAIINNWTIKKGEMERDQQNEEGTKREKKKGWKKEKKGDYLKGGIPDYAKGSGGCEHELEH